MSEYEFPVEAGHVMMASAQYNPDYPLRPSPGEPWIDVASLSGEQPFLHAEQHFEYHSPIRRCVRATSSGWPAPPITTGSSRALHGDDRVAGVFRAGGAPWGITKQAYRSDRRVTVQVPRRWAPG